MKSFATFLMLALLGVVACSKPPKTHPRILVSPKGLVHNFWVTVKTGADSAGKELGAEVIWKGPAQETDIAGQIAILEDYINKKVDAIVLAACDTKALNPLIDRAMDNGIPVVTIDSGVDYDRPLSFIATDNIKAAELAADALARLVGFKGEVALMPHVPGAATSIIREEGFKKGIAKYAAIELVAVQYSHSDVATAMSAIENILSAHPNLDGIFATTEAGTLGTVQALTARNKIGKVKVVGFDAATDEITALRNGGVQALVVQDPFKMGYLGVKVALDAIAKRPVAKRIDTGVYVVTAENMDTAEMRRILSPNY
ncbi:MAG: ABC transporter substrate-binding protein [candidate division KSB1 bacterium]|nr:ABC transporter substrate-binding protein [candidate division KSB1 bacterium]MDZ7304651.1 ABC transporter substrate-binding protein [candidate division KSB1 bacterium]MDZ7313783.1 ABC transporter substrate-binding protein [candidate division KSB1 bacterium]